MTWPTKGARYQLLHALHTLLRHVEEMPESEILDDEEMIDLKIRCESADYGIARAYVIQIERDAVERPDIYRATEGTKP